MMAASRGDGWATRSPITKMHGDGIMGDVLRFARHLSAGGFGKRQKIVGGHMAPRDRLNFGSKRPFRRRQTAPKSVDSAAVDLEEQGNLVVGQLSSVHPLGQLHAGKVHQVHSASQALCAPDAVDHDLICAQDAQMPRKRGKRQWKSHALLRAWRKSAGLSQEEAAPQLGIDRSQLVKVEQGKVRYTPELLENAAKLYGCRPGDLLNHDPNSLEWAVVNSWRRLSPENRAKVLDKMQAYIEGLEAGAVAAE